MTAGIKNISLGRGEKDTHYDKIMTQEKRIGEGGCVSSRRLVIKGRGNQDQQKRTKNSGRGATRKQEKIGGSSTKNFKLGRERKSATGPSTKAARQTAEKKGMGRDQRNTKNLRTRRMRQEKVESLQRTLISQNMGQGS